MAVTKKLAMRYLNDLEYDCVNNDWANDGNTSENWEAMILHIKDIIDYVKNSKRKPRGIK